MGFHSLEGSCGGEILTKLPFWYFDYVMAKEFEFKP